MAHQVGPDGAEQDVRGPRGVRRGRRLAGAGDGVGEVTGREVLHESLEPGDVERALAAAMPVEVARMPVRLDGLIASGAEDRVTDTVERITGRPPGDLRTVLHRDLRP
ncbi:hypothetical protein [Nocardiopsis sp. NPDC057823]|uniref:hypothetical protein n=1 Tax=Nocardiopsis sp. NPDC057823 TaxID=3346256 RepID=UPI003672336B